MQTLVDAPERLGEIDELEDSRVNRIRTTGTFLAALCITAFGASQAAIAYDYDDYMEDQWKAERRAIRHQQRYYTYPQVNSVVVPSYNNSYVQPHGYSMPYVYDNYNNNYGRVGGTFSRFLMNLGL